MQKLIILLVFSLAISSIVAQTSIWRIEKDGQEILIGGTIHILRASDYPLPKEYDLAYKEATEIVFEADIKKLDNQEVSLQIMANAMYSDGRTLRDVLAEETYDALIGEAVKLGLPIAAINPYKPSMAVLMLTVMKLKALGVSEEGIDQHYYHLAEEDKKPKIFLETVEEQIKIITKMGDGNEDDFVNYSLRDLNDLEDVFDQMVNTWRDGSGEAMEEQIERMKEEFPTVYQQALVKRNKKWIPILESMLQSTSKKLVLVGALHLHGKDGVLEILKKKGYEISRF